MTNGPSNDKPSVDSALESIDESKRDTLRRLVTGVFVAPVVASFAMSGLTTTASAQGVNPNSNQFYHS